VPSAVTNLDAVTAVSPRRFDIKFGFKGRRQILKQRSRQIEPVRSRQNRLRPSLQAVLRQPPSEQRF